MPAIRLHDPVSAIERWRVYGRYAPTCHWLGLGLVPPEGLHGSRRYRLVMRHTRKYRGEGGVTMYRALIAAYGPDRELHIMKLLRPQRLDDALWRQVYALMIKGGPIWQFDLIRTITRLTSSDRKVADVEAERLMADWYQSMHSHGRSRPLALEEDL